MKRLKQQGMLLSLLLLAGSLKAQETTDWQKHKMDFAAGSKTWLEGFERSTGGNDFTYHSLRDDVSECMLTRCTDGKMAVEWLTAAAPVDVSKGATFLWLAAMDMAGKGIRFFVYVNDELRFTIISGQKESFSMDAFDGWTLGFTAVMRDRYNDVHGYMHLYAPPAYVMPSKPLKIRVVGEAAKANTWIIIYKAKDALSYLQESTSFENWSKSENSKDSVPGNILLLDKGFQVSRERKNEDGTFSLESTRLYRPHTLDDLKTLSGSDLAKGKIYLMNSSHQDIAWMDELEKCVIERDTMLITPLLDHFTSSTRFDIEDVLMIREYLHRHPERKKFIRIYLDKGWLSCGSAYIQPYEEMYSGEALVRQFYLGTRWMQKNLGYKPNIYWNVDVPGRTLQMPQILKKSGTSHMVISRQEEGLYNWYSPDGSFVTTYSPGHYSTAYPWLQRRYPDATGFLAKNSLKFEKYFRDKNAVPAIPVISDWDMSAARDYTGLTSFWDGISGYRDEKGKTKALKLPEMKIVSMSEYFSSLDKSDARLTAIRGERPAVWLYIHGPAHHKATSASREGDIILTAAEKYATIDALTSGSFLNYPMERLTQAWEAKIYPDHGWGGKGGNVTDDIFRAKYEFALAEARSILDGATRRIASRVQTDPQKGIPLIVFNNLGWKRTDPVTFHIDLEPGHAKSLVLKDAAGRSIEVQLSGTSIYNDSSLRSTEINFIAEDVPSLGYKTYYLSMSEVPVTRPGGYDVKISPESAFYRLDFDETGHIRQITDKELKRPLLDVSKFSGAEVFTMKSVGEDAGEFADIQHPAMEGFARTTSYKRNNDLTEDGPVYYQLTEHQHISNADIEVKVRFYYKIKRIDIMPSLLNWDGTMFREYRMAFPLNMAHAEVAYEVPFAVVRVGKDELDGAAGERYITPCREVHPRGILDWISASDSLAGVTMSSSVSVADYIDPTADPVTYPVLQPLLLASRRSCHGEGPEYPQCGDHHYFFSLTSHKPGWENGYRQAKQANDPLYVILDPKAYKDASLPEELSFFSADASNVIISTVKKAEDDNDVVVRAYDAEGKDVKVNIRSFLPLKSVEKTDLIEENGKVIPSGQYTIPVDLGHHSIETFKIKY